MISRGLWLVAGAVLGVTGYRRITRMLRPAPGRRAVREPSRPPVAVAGVVPSRELPAASGVLLVRVLRAVGHTGRETGLFLRDVRMGMAEYLDRHPGRSGNTLITQPPRASLAGPGEEDDSKDGR